MVSVFGVTFPLQTSKDNRNGDRAIYKAMLEETPLEEAKYFRHIATVT